MMAYANGIVVVVIDQNNRPIREINKDGKRTAFIPFGTEYKLRIKNNNNFRCKAQILIDGTDVMFGSKLVLGAYQSTDIERFVENNSSGRKFKFASLEQAAATGELADPTSPDNGRIQVNIEREWPGTVSGWITLCHTGHSYGGSGFTTCATNSATPTGGAGGTAAGGAGSGQAAGGGAMLNAQNVGVTLDCALNSEPIQSCYHVNSSSQAVPRGHVGVTAEGGESKQQFMTVNDFYTLHHCTIDIWLRAPEYAVQQPVPTVVPQGWSVKFNGKVPTVYLNGAPFPGVSSVSILDGELKLNGPGMNIQTREFAVI